MFARLLRSNTRHFQGIDDSEISNEALSEIFKLIITNAAFRDEFKRMMPATQQPDQRVPLPPTCKKNLCLFFGGHGTEVSADGEISVFDAILNSYPRFFEVGGRGKKSTSQDPAKVSSLERYIDECVTLTMAMGEPGLSAPMDPEIETGKYAGFSTSEADLVIATNVFQLFNRVYKNLTESGEIAATPVTIDEDTLEMLDYIVRHQLRSNFNKYWGAGGESDVTVVTGNAWYASMATLIREKKIWLKNKLVARTGPNGELPTINRLYSLVPNNTREKRFRAREGLHCLLALDSYGREERFPLAGGGSSSLVQDIPDILGDKSLVLTKLDVNNIKFQGGRVGLRAIGPRSEAGLSMGDRLIEYIKTLHREGTVEYEALAEIITKIQSLEKNTVELSDVVFFGYKMGFKITAYDPTCRPVYAGDDEVPFEIARVGRLGPDTVRRTGFCPQESQDPDTGECRMSGGKRKKRKTIKRQTKRKKHNFKKTKRNNKRKSKK